MSFTKASLLLLLLFSFLLRIYQIADFPPSLNWDEVSLGYNAYSVLKTGRDEWQSPIPNIFRAYGDYKLPGYIYAAIPFIAALGPSPVSVRLPSAIAGTGLVLLTFILSYRFFSHKYLSLLAALLVAISPWSLFLSRVAVEANLGAFITVLGICLLLSGRSISGIFFLFLSAWTYNSARIFTPLFLIVYFFITRRDRTRSQYLLAIILFIPLFWQLLQPTGLARFHNLTLLDSGSIAQINELRQRPGGRLLYNKVTYFTYLFTKNYLNHFLPKFLFFEGGSHYQFSIPHTGLLFLATLPFFYLGLVIIFFKFRSRSAGFTSISNLKPLIFWILIAPIAGSITRDSPHTLRAIVTLPLPMIISSLGLFWFVSKFRIKKSAILIIYLILLYFNFENYLTTNVYAYRSKYSWAWQYGYEQAVRFIRERYDQYDQIIFTKRYGEPHEFVAFYWPWSPLDFSKAKVWDYHADWYWVNRLDKFVFVNDWEMSQAIATLPSDRKYLIVSSTDNVPKGTTLTRINFLDGQPAFVIKEL